MELDYVTQADYSDKVVGRLNFDELRAKVNLRLYRYHRLLDSPPATQWKFVFVSHAMILMRIDERNALAGAELINSFRANKRNQLIPSGICRAHNWWWIEMINLMTRINFVFFLTSHLDAASDLSHNIFFTSSLNPNIPAPWIMDTATCRHEFHLSGMQTDWKMATPATTLNWLTGKNYRKEISMGVKNENEKRWKT